MSADWFCKIGEKKVGPLNGHQLKTIVAKGQLKPEHLVRRGDEGPWVPAGRIKGLFPSAGGDAADGRARKPSKPAGKALPKAAKGDSLPTAEQAPAPPAAEVPQELAMGEHHKHVEMNVDKFNIEATPVMVSRKKIKRGLQGLKKSEQKKAKVILLSLIGGGLAFALLVIVYKAATGGLSSGEKKEEAAAAIGTGTPADSGGAKAEPEKKSAPKAPDEPTWPSSFKIVSVENALAGSVDVMALKPVRGSKPEGIKTDESEVLIVPVNLKLKEGAKKSVEFKGWSDDKFKKGVRLTDDKEGKGNSYAFLGQYVRNGGDAKEITEKRIQIGLVFELPSGKMPKTMYLALPPAALHADGAPTIGYRFSGSEVANDTAKSAAPSSSTAPADHKDEGK